MRLLKPVAAFSLSLFLFFAAASLMAQPASKLKPRERCVVCGMFVAKYPDWVTQVKLTDGSVLFFDGMKDLFVFLFHPERFDRAGAKVSEIWAKDYYTLEWIDAKKAWYVIGSDVYGPMGHELIPFADRKAAESFASDHHGKQILSFEEIGEPLVESLRVGQKMRH